MRNGRRTVGVTLMSPARVLSLGENHSARTPCGRVRRVLIIVIRVLTSATLRTSTSRTRTIRTESFDAEIGSLFGFTTFPFIFPHRWIVHLTQVFFPQHIPGRTGEYCSRGGWPPVVYRHVLNTHAPSVACLSVRQVAPIWLSALETLCVLSRSCLHSKPSHTVGQMLNVEEFLGCTLFID
jgi:hypothetical protein